jgi:hypothetical protein
VAIPVAPPAGPATFIDTHELRDAPKAEGAPPTESISNASTQHLPVTTHAGWFTWYTWVRNIGMVIIFLSARARHYIAPIPAPFVVSRTHVWAPACTASHGLPSGGV